ncbi:MAG: hypothetical protein EOO20_14050 [Chryseobacterium sp.]|nr:MAG: hypothetical protein EOO20_14050 [Chryseobacterium sp.]
MRHVNVLFGFCVMALLLTSVGCHDVSQPRKQPAIILTDAKKTALKDILIKVYDSDQKYRAQAMLASNQHGLKSKEVSVLAKKIDSIDYVNLPVVKKIIKTYGWLGSKDIGEKANAAIYLVIQHADQKDRASFLPIMRNAVKSNSASKQDLANLEDRVALDQGRAQIYGTQLGMNEKTGKYYLFPLKDPEHVDLRRSKMGMIPIKEYLKQWGIIYPVM